MTSNTPGTTGNAIPRAFPGCGTFGGIGGARHLVGRGLDRKAAFATLDAATAGGASCGALALARMMAHPGCTAPVVGPSRAAPHLRHVAEALGLAVTADAHALLAQ